MRRALLLVVAAASLWLAPGALAAGWCGGASETAVDRPDVVTGPQVHAVVAVPSDAGDTFATRAGQVADDATSLLSWWQGQDPTRVPRVDQAVFGGAACLDISFVRLPGTAASYAGSGSNPAFKRIAGELVAAGQVNRFKKYLVYFDGPSVETNVCGTGGGDFSTGPSYAIVWLAGCATIPTDTIATHELLHALGAVDPTDPHCPADRGHPCDSPTDVLAATADGAPLSQKVLDFGHDDYYAHSNPWEDIQDSVWLHRLDLPQVALNVGLSGAGTVQSAEPGVDCTASCTTQWDQGAQVSLVPVPAPTTRFVRWTGTCAGSVDCSLTLDQATSTTAVFGPLRIPVRLTTAGRGKIVCTPKCAKTFAAGDRLTLRAIAATGWRFTGWSGACKSKAATCRPKTDYAIAARATFKRR